MTYEDILRWFRERYPRVKPGTVRAHIVAGTVNDRNRLHYAMNVGDLFFKLGRSTLQRFDPSKHGAWPRERLRSLAQPDEGDDLHEEVTVHPAGDDAIANLAHATVGHSFEPRVLELAHGLTHGFDLVSSGEEAVGLVIYLDRLSSSEHGWASISEAVWLLEKVPGSPMRFLVLVDDRRTPTLWLEHLGRLAEDITFYYFDGQHLTDLRGDS